MTLQLSWDDARTACINEGHGMQFAAFKTREALQFIEADYWNAADGGVLYFIYYICRVILNQIEFIGHGSQYASVSVFGIIDIFAAVDCNQTSLNLWAWEENLI